MAAQEYYGSGPALSINSQQARSVAPYSGGAPLSSPGTPGYYGEQQLPPYGYPSQGAPGYLSEYPPEKVSLEREKTFLSPLHL